MEKLDWNFYEFVNKAVILSKLKPCYVKHESFVNKYVAAFLGKKLLSNGFELATKVRET